MEKKQPIKTTKKAPAKEESGKKKATTRTTRSQSSGKKASAPTITETVDQLPEPQNASEPKIVTPSANPKSTPSKNSESSDVKPKPTPVATKGSLGLFRTQLLRGIILLALIAWGINYVLFNMVFVEEYKPPLLTSYTIFDAEDVAGILKQDNRLRDQSLAREINKLLLNKQSDKPLNVVILGNDIDQIKKFTSAIEKKFANANGACTIRSSDHSKTGLQQKLLDDLNDAKCQKVVLMLDHETCKQNECHHHLYSCIDPQVAVCDFNSEKSLGSARSSKLITILHRSKQTELVDKNNTDSADIITKTRLEEFRKEFSDRFLQRFIPLTLH